MSVEVQAEGLGNFIQCKLTGMLDAFSRVVIPKWILDFVI